MARIAGKVRGDMRAMEEEMERHNPIVGGSATPSMGLSQFRGGRHGSDSDSSSSSSSSDDENEQLVGGSRRRRQAKAKGMSEAMEMGLHLGKHLHGLHGAGFFDDFKSGFNSVIAPIARVAKPFLPMLGPEGALASAGLSALGYGHAQKGARGRPRKGGATNSDTGAYEGHGRERDDRAFMGMGTGGRKKRAPAGPNDGRRARAEIVKKVMAEKGMKMIEASKYVKAHNLY